MKNMQTKKGGIGAIALVFAAALLLTLPGCQGPLGTRDDAPNARTGTVLLNMGHLNMSRAIMPDNIGLENFDEINFAFTRDGEDAPYAEFDWLDGEPVSIELEEGNWHLAVEAILNGEVVADFGGYFEVEADDTNMVNIYLTPISAGYGTFTWNVTFPPSATGTVEIFAVNNRVIDWYDSVDYEDVVSGAEGSITGINVGTYFALFTFVHPDYGTLSLGMDLRVFANLESVFTRTFELRHFPDWDGDDGIIAAWNYTVAQTATLSPTWPANSGTRTAGSSLEFFYADGTTRANLGRTQQDRAAINVANNNAGWFTAPGTHTATDFVAVGIGESAGWVITLDTTGHENIMFSAYQSSSNNGPRDFRLAYRIGDSGTWTVFGGEGTVTALGDVSPAITGPVNMNQTFANVPLPATVNNQAAVQIRVWIASTAPRGTGNLDATSGNTSLNNIVFRSTEPSVWADQNAVNAAALLAQDAVDAIPAANDITEAYITAAVNAAIAGTGIGADWTGAFTLIEAEVGTPGAITGTITLTLNAATAIVTVNLTIPALVEGTPFTIVWTGFANPLLNDGAVTITRDVAAGTITLDFPGDLLTDIEWLGDPQQSLIGNGPTLYDIASIPRLVTVRARANGSDGMYSIIIDTVAGAIFE